MQGPADPPERREHPFGRALAQELLTIHAMLRRELEVVRGLAGAVAAGEEAGAVRERVASQQSNSPIWQLKVNCIHYCRFVHGHHGFEDGAWFPALRRADPAIDPVVDKLEDDHRRISDYTDEVVAAADALDERAGAGPRERLGRALELLGEQLLEHLDYEEEAISPTLLSLERWPA